MLKPQDILVLLKLLVSGDRTVPFSRLAADLEMSPSEVHQALKRAQKAGLLRLEPRGKGGHIKTPKREALLEFLVHGLKYVFPPDRRGETRGIPTLWAAPPLQGKLLHDRKDLPPVWPDPEGPVHGLEFTPLFRSVPRAAKRDPGLYELLVLVDAIRGGQARERKLAARELEKRLAA